MKTPEEIADDIATNLEGHFRDWLMPGEHAEAKAVIARHIAPLVEENRAVKEGCESLILSMRRERSELEQDRKRLDWLEGDPKNDRVTGACVERCMSKWHEGAHTFRAAIDAAMKPNP